MFLQFFNNVCLDKNVNKRASKTLNYLMDYTAIILVIFCYFFNRFGLHEKNFKKMFDK